MKAILLTIFFLTSVSASAERLVCWDKYDHLNHRPMVTAQILSDNKITNLKLGDVGIEGVLVGKPNPRSRKYKNFNYFATGSESGRGYVILPKNILDHETYFSAAYYGSNGEGGGTMHLNCLVR